MTQKKHNVDELLNLGFVHGGQTAQFAPSAGAEFSSAPRNGG